MRYYVYILKCSDDSLYTGITNDIVRRLKAHLGAIKGGAKYTRSHPVRSIEAAWLADDKQSAAKTEYALKRLPREKKLMLIQNPQSIADISDDIFEMCPRDFLDNAFQKAVSAKK